MRKSSLMQPSSTWRMEEWKKANSFSRERRKSIHLTGVFMFTAESPMFCGGPTQGVMVPLKVRERQRSPFWFVVFVLECIVVLGAHMVKAHPVSQGAIEVVI